MATSGACVYMIKLFYIIILLIQRSLNILPLIFFQKSPPNTLELNDNRFAERRKQILESCKALNLTSDAKGDELGPPSCEVGERHMFVYCAIPKSGCWFWGRILKIIEHEKKFSSLNEMRMSNSHIKPLIELKKFLSNHTKPEVDAFKSKSVKFLFVREPYGRLLSAYNNKILSPNPLFWGMGKKIVAATRDNPSNDSLKYGHDVTFAEYIKYLLIQFESGKSLDPHFAPMNTICDPCRFNFDYFGKLETFASDAEFIIEKLKEKNKNISVNFADFDKETALDRVNGVIDYLFEKLKETKGLKYPTYNFYLRVWRDLQIAGHLSKELDMPILKSEQNLTLSKHEFLNLIKYALSRPMNQTLVKKQRNEALLQAYRSVPKEDLERLSKFVKKDCILFGYDERPRHIFDQPTKPHQDTFNYFDAI